MQILREMGGRFQIAGELFGFLWQRKMWWMMPIVFIMVFIGLLIGFGSATGVGPFVYTLF
jgi:hypothetical protein